MFFTIFPLLMHDGYTDILYVKTGYFYLLSGLYIFCMAVCLWFENEKKHQEYLSLRFFKTDFFCVAFGIVALGSWGMCANKSAQFWGIYGRNMGLLTILFCIVCYFLVSRYLEWKQYILTGILCTVMLVCVVAVCNHLGFDILSVYTAFDKHSEFLSTMGNINTLSAYIGVFVPFGMALFVVSDGEVSPVFYGIFVFVGFMGIISANSDSAYLTIGAAFGILLYMAKTQDRGVRLLVLACAYPAAVMCIHLLRKVRGVEKCMVFRPGLSEMLVDVRLNILLIIVFLGLLVFLRVKKNSWYAMRRCLLGIVVLAVVSILISFIYINLAWGKKEAKAHLGEFYRYLYLSNSWGTKRLRIWKAALHTFFRLPVLNKVTGVGPAGFYFATQEYLTAGELAVFQKQGNLVDAHNIYLQQLVLFGILGVLLFVGIFVSAVIFFWKAGEKKKEMWAFAVFSIAFLVQGLINNSHIYMDSMAFLMIAMGMGRSKK